MQQAFEKYKKYDRKKRDNSKTGVTGVSITPESRYRADITYKGSRFYLGKFDRLEEAIQARKEAEKLSQDFLDNYYIAHPKAKKKHR